MCRNEPRYNETSESLQRTDFVSSVMAPLNDPKATKEHTKIDVLSRSFTNNVIT